MVRSEVKLQMTWDCLQPLNYLCVSTTVFEALTFVMQEQTLSFHHHKAMNTARWHLRLTTELLPVCCPHRTAVDVSTNLLKNTFIFYLFYNYKSSMKPLPCWMELGAPQTCVLGCGQSCLEQLPLLPSKGGSHAVELTGESPWAAELHNPPPILCWHCLFDRNSTREAFTVHPR